MQLKKTKKGNLSFQLGWDVRQTLSGAFMSYLETESANLLFVHLKNSDNIVRHLRYSAAHQFFNRFSAKFFTPSRFESFILNRLEALVLLEFISKGFDNDIEISGLRNALHQALS